MGAGQFLKELESLINRYNKENESNTPDFLLAGYLADCMVAYKNVVKKRDQWYGFEPHATTTVTTATSSDREVSDV